MKKTFISLLLALAVGSTGCKYLDVDPEMGLDENQVFTVWDNFKSYYYNIYAMPTGIQCGYPLYLDMNARRYTWYQFTDLSDAGRLLRSQQIKSGTMGENAAEFRIDENHVGVTGFSAGGHLAAMLATIYDEKEVKTVLGHKASLCRPDAAVLAYPVISSGEKAHFGSFDSLCGDDLALKERLSLEKRVTPDSAPAFIWTTANDGAVPSENSLMLAAAYKENGVPFELHIFENGVHGLSLATEETGNVNAPVAAWVGLCITWLKSHGFTVCDAIKKPEF